MTMPAGRYYVGDLCYVMTDWEWDEFCDITIKVHECVDGEFEFADGRRFATYGTAWGDGVYSDQHGNQYPVDAGLIGCIRVEDIRAEKLRDVDAGTIHEFGTDFVTGGGRGTGHRGGVIQFGAVAIETDAQEEALYDE